MLPTGFRQEYAEISAIYITILTRVQTLIKPKTTIKSKFNIVSNPIAALKKRRGRLRKSAN